ncbi:MAG: hypothetical protein ACTSX7_13460 [Alphaproteobacteria bacterium]
MSRGLQTVAAMMLSGLVLAGCGTLMPSEEVALNKSLAAYSQRQSAVDLEQCAATHGENYKDLRQCVDERKAIRQTQILELRKALRQRQLRTGQTSCLNPVTGAAEMCQEI